MSRKQRDTVTYDLVRGRGNQVVYRGTTSQDVSERATQHRADGKKFDRIIQTSRRMTEEGARHREADNLDRYRKSENAGAIIPH